jgi:mannosyl-3-phosphoglycerate phosphatase
MLPPRVVIFTAVHREFLDSRSDLISAALAEIERQRVPLVLSTMGTRAQLELFRRRIGHGHPFLTEHGGGLFIPDGYFALHLEGAKRIGRYFCVPFGRSHSEASAAVEEIAAEAGASVVRYAEMSTPAVARNTGESLREAEVSRQREFSERFFFVGNVEAASTRFAQIAQKLNWKCRLGDPFCELYSGNDEACAVRHLMSVYRKALRSRIRSVAIGCAAEDVSLLSAADHAVVLPHNGNRFDPALASHLSRAARDDTPGPAGWSKAVARILQTR